MFLEGAPFLSSQRCNAGLFSCFWEKWNLFSELREKKETNGNKEAEISKENKGNIQKSDTRNGIPKEKSCSIPTKKNPTNQPQNQKTNLSPDD